MTNLNYKNYLKNKDFDIEKNYYELFKYKETKFDKFKKKYPYNLLFHDIEFKEIIFFTKNLLFKIENRIIQQKEKISKMKLKKYLIMKELIKEEKLLHFLQKILISELVFIAIKILLLILIQINLNQIKKFLLFNLTTFMTKELIHIWHLVFIILFHLVPLVIQKK